MAYLALYRKWRPGTFNDIVGQEHISQTLKNALLQNRVAHAYLFCGPRGTGKTSSAKVFAKGVNCLDLADGEPCNQCSNCEKINSGSSLDVFEIDAASNRGVDEIRELRERVKFAPSEGKYKIYIIDEVHMLTTEAFNALLKTLEEPPKNIIFILATTEPHKIPLTILSRCQRFDFRPIEMDRILDRLVYVCDQIKQDFDREALQLIAKAAEGGMRDALSTLDQCISFGGEKVAVKDVNSILGTVNESTLYSLIQSILIKDVEKALQTIDLVVKEGKDLQHFLKDIINGFRNLLILNINNSGNDLIVASNQVISEIKELAKETKKNTILELIDILTDIEKEMKWSNQPRLMLELAIIKCCSIKDVIDINHLVEKLEELEIELKRLKEDGIQTTTNNRIDKDSKVSDIKKKAAERQVVKLENCDQELLDEIKGLWPKMLEFLKKKDKMQIQALLIEAEPIHAKENTLVIAFEHSFHKDQIELGKNKTIVEDTVSRGLKRPIVVKCLLKAEVEEFKGQDNKKQDHSLVNNAQSFFGPDVNIQIKD